jgi:hypothetical protein
VWRWLRAQGEVQEPIYSRLPVFSKLSGYTRVTDFILAWRANAGKNVKAFVPLKFELGEAFQSKEAQTTCFCTSWVMRGNQVSPHN